MTTRYDHVSPRLGLAWDVFGTGKTSVRAGVGLFFGGVSGNEWNQTSNYYPFTLRYTFGVPGTLANPYKNTPSPFPFNYVPGKVVAPPAGASILGVAPGFDWPETYQINASVQQQLSKNIILGVAYVAALSRKLSYQVDNNYPVFNAITPTLNATTNVNNRRPIDTGILGSILAIQSNGTSNYNAMQVTFVERMSRGISLNGYYAWTKTLEGFNVDGTTPSAEDFTNLKLDKGPTITDQRNLFVLSAVWEPNYVHGNRYLGAALNHWKVSPIIKAYSGSPFSVTTGTDSNADGNTTDRANQIANPYDTTTTHSSRALEVKRYFNTASFCAYTTANPAACQGTGPGGSDGTTRRNGFFGPAYKDVDLAIIRDFHLYECVSFELRGEATNVFNFVELNNPNSSINLAATTNQITAAAPMRVIQVGGRLTF